MEPVPVAALRCGRRRRRALRPGTRGDAAAAGSPASGADGGVSRRVAWMTWRGRALAGAKSSTGDRAEGTVFTTKNYLTSERAAYDCSPGAGSLLLPRDREPGRRVPHVHAEGAWARNQPDLRSRPRRQPLPEGAAPRLAEP